MPKCKECGGKFGLLELKQGVCKQCINKKTPPCLNCRKNFEVLELTEGYCTSCYKQYQESKRRKQQAQKLNALTERQLNGILLTTEMSPDIEIERRIEIITAECAFGMNLFRDLFAGVRDIVGGRSKPTQNELRDARKIVLTELRKEAYAVGANAVVAVDLDYREFSGGGKSMLFVVATGTAVIAKI